ncbi:MAG TPA: anthrone oxygenase family protein [Solirubrobacteraceae bacterium]|jgi:uncharacterized membrane protein
MSSTWSWVSLVTAIGCGLVAGVFFAFSGFVMAGLDRLPPGHGVAAMQSINRTALRPPLMIAIFATAALCVGLGIWAVTAWGDRRAGLTLAGCVLYVVGAVGVTGAGNVPLNDKLDAVDPRSAGAAAAWSHYVGSWMAWNHVRGALCAAAAVLLTIALAKE